MDFQFLSAKSPQAVAHRGGSVGVENSLHAFASALKLGYRYLETDVRISNDGQLMVFHDETLERITGQPKAISDMTCADIQAIDLTAENPAVRSMVPTLEELLRAFPKAYFMIDPKDDAAVEPLAELLVALEVVDRVCVGSFKARRVRAIRNRLGPRLCTSGAPSEVFFAYLLSLVSFGARLFKPRLPFGCVQIPISYGPWRNLAKARLVKRFQRLGLQVHYWTINDRRNMERLLDNGADMIITDEVELLKQVMLERGQWH